MAVIAVVLGVAGIYLMYEAVHDSDPHPITKAKAALTGAS